MEIYFVDGQNRQKGRIKTDTWYTSHLFALATAYALPTLSAWRPNKKKKIRTNDNENENFLATVKSYLHVCNAMRPPSCIERPWNTHRRQLVSKRFSVRPIKELILIRYS